MSGCCGGHENVHRKGLLLPYLRAVASDHPASGKLKASRDEWAEVQKDEEHYHYHDRHQYEVVCTHNTRPLLNLCYYTYGYAGPTYRSRPVYAGCCMSIRPVLRAVTTPSAESTDLSRLDD